MILSEGGGGLNFCVLGTPNAGKFQTSTQNIHTDLYIICTEHLPYLSSAIEESTSDFQLIFFGLHACSVHDNHESRHTKCYFLIGNSIQSRRETELSLHNLNTIRLHRVGVTNRVEQTLLSYYRSQQRQKKKVDCVCDNRCLIPHTVLFVSFSFGVSGLHGSL